MTEPGPPEPESADGQPERAGDPRKTRGIRFSESEWEEVKAAAERRDVPAAEFVRATILEIARGRESPGAAAELASLAPLIERTFRYAWMLATHRRDELIAEGRGGEMEKLVETARELQDSLQAGRE